MNRKQENSKKMMLLIGMISITMTFAGLTSAYVVSSYRSDWLSSFEIPFAFTISTILLLISSLTFHLAKHYVLKNNKPKSLILVSTTIFLAFLFVFYQFKGFQEIIKSGYYFTGAQSSITTSFLYVLVIVHLVHLIAGIIVLLKVFYKISANKYIGSNKLGIQLGVIFWHFLDFLWLYLYLFMVLYR
ncbi:MAG: cytochrome oxidase subunit III [Flavobacteriaceae bacterium]|nr:cytochrome oxidase subunit III [Flavobacteriaceae bacterium]|tara:strand:+ start:18758 stop:19318 length:561 start_codon:yes stop_codon:yes gene_type:complete